MKASLDSEDLLEVSATLKSELYSRYSSLLRINPRSKLAIRSVTPICSLRNVNVSFCASAISSPQNLFVVDRFALPPNLRHTGVKGVQGVQGVQLYGSESFDGRDYKKNRNAREEIEEKRGNEISEGIERDESNPSPSCLLLAGL